MANKSNFQYFNTSDQKERIALSNIYVSLQCLHDKITVQQDQIQCVQKAIAQLRRNQSVICDLLTSIKEYR